MFRAVIIVLTLLLAGVSQAATLKIATLAPDGTAWMKAMRQSAAEIKKRTNSRVEIRFYPGGVMGNDKSVLRKIRVGQLHGAALAVTGLQQIYNDAIIYGLPFSFKSFAEVEYVRQRMDKSIIKGLNKAGFTSFGLLDGDFAYLLSQAPISNSDELKNRKVWIPNGDLVSATGLKALGVVAVPLAIPDVLTGLQTGLIDTVGNSSSGAIALQWHSKVKYLTDMPLFYLYGSLVIQNKAFNRLKSKDRVVVQEVFSGAIQQLDRQSRQDNAAARQALQNQGIKILTVDSAQQAYIEQTVSDSMVALTKQGFFSSKALQTLQKHIAAYRK